MGMPTSRSTTIFRISRAFFFLFLSWVFMIIDGQNYACEACVRGHRVRTCQHHERPLKLVSKKGRPVSQCQHCRTLRRSRSVHVKCSCGKQANSNTLQGSFTENKAGSCYCNYGGRCTCAYKKEQPPLDITLLTNSQPDYSTELNLPNMHGVEVQSSGSSREPLQEHPHVTSEIPIALSNHNTIPFAFQHLDTQLPLPDMSCNVGEYSENVNFGLFGSPHTPASILSTDRSSSDINWTNYLFDTTSSDIQAQNVNDSDFTWLTQPLLGSTSLLEEVPEAGDCGTITQDLGDGPASLEPVSSGGPNYTDSFSETEDLGWFSWDA